MAAFENVRSVDNLIIVSGQLPIDEQGKTDKAGSYHNQALESLREIEKVALKEGLNKNNIVKTTLFLTDINKLSEVNDAYNEFFDERKPARSALQVVALAQGVSVEIDAILKKD
ncbi:Rid family hydrolase [Lactobacillus sp. ESL0791]|uniref:Rid family hydrolase n=1 Tax=Lactobacillus sp. ESL0791 TaxID=2983234 RepID=UPI0023F9B0A9|nr:Rid family hydrolase [Lactobacillus sp. ESL0791]MDF7639662.1 Rid family hydrolase [Lactobacillus sp. ESL0791]